MGSGLSMSSVNKIKELANSREYSLALDIIDSQDLSKSLNPQFLRLCGDVYIKTGRYIDAREILLMAHKIAPEAKRVMYSLVDLYLRVGYFDLAKTYYDIYMFDADEYNEETVQLKYIYDKANKVDSNVLEEYLYPRYVQSQDYDWSFELYLLYKVMGKDEDAESLAREYAATFKNIDNLNRIADIEDNKLDINELSYVYASEQESDDNPEQEELRLVEQKLLEADELRIHPKEAEITIMVDDNEEAEIGSKRKLKKFLKEQEKLEKKKAKEEAQKADEESAADENESAAEDSSNKDESTSEDVVEAADDEANKENISSDNVLKEDSSDSSSDSEIDNNQEDESAEESSKTKRGFFKKVFQKKRKDLEIESENETELSVDDNSKVREEIVSEDEIEEKSDEEMPDTENIIESSEGSVEEVVEASKEDADEHLVEESNVDESDGEEEPEDRYNKELFELTDATTEEDLNGVDEESQVTTDFSYDTAKNNKSNMNSAIFVDYDDDSFEAEAETIDGLKETFVTPPKAKEEVVFEEAIFADDDEDEFEVDDFSSDDDSEFGVMAQDDYDESAEDDCEFKLDEEDIFYGEVEGLDEDDADKEDVSDEISEESLEQTEESECQIEEAELAEDDDEEFDADDFSVETDDEFGEMSESYENVDEPLVEEAYVEEETYVEGTVEEESYVEESSVEETYEDESHEEESYVEESYAEESEIETETYEEVEEEETAVEEEVFVEEETYVEETVEEESYEDESSAEETYEDESHEEESYVEVTYAKEHEIETKEYEKQEEQIEEIPKFDIPKKKIDFPVFKSSLFPNYNKEITTVENNFNEIMTEAKDKIQENNKKEEQMLKEAEALLASLGIDLGSVAPTTTSYAQINETLYEGPSRDELKASLKIDSVKKNILNKLKEYR